ncbi:MAG: preprotein translocase subunit SecE [Candidatus Aminicenantes bacterium]|nr:preprotein translocase subunit SecE [Candidatus Aminicenantes bacterium]
MSDKVRWYKRFWAFLKDARAELRKVTWPSRAEVTSTTVVVILSVFFFGFYLFFVDVAFTWIITKVKDLLG